MPNRSTKDAFAHSDLVVSSIKKNVPPPDQTISLILLRISAITPWTQAQTMYLEARPQSQDHFRQQQVNVGEVRLCPVVIPVRT